MLERKTDAQLVAQFKRGNLDAYEELIQRYAGKAFSLASRLTRNTQDAEEVLQDVFVTVFRKLHRFEGKSTFSSWLYRVTVNAAFMKLRKRKQNPTSSVEELLPQVLNSALARTTVTASEGDNVTARHELIAALEDAINRLPLEYRPVFVLRDVDGLSSREVGKMLELSIPAVKSRLHRARTMLRRRLAKFYREYADAEGIKVANS